MTNDELKKKIAQIIADYFCPQRNEHKNLWGDDRLCYSKMNFAECERVAECTDALIAAGIGDVSKWKAYARALDLYLKREKNMRCWHYLTYDGNCDRNCEECWEGYFAREKQCYLMQAEKELAEEGKDE